MRNFVWWKNLGEDGWWPLTGNCIYNVPDGTPRGSFTPHADWLIGHEDSDNDILFWHMKDMYKHEFFL